MMKKLVFALIAVMLAGCGNWSNADIEFLYALPSKKALQANIPQKGTVEGALSQRKDGLGVGATSPLYTRTHQGAADFNAGLFRLLDLIEFVKTLNPTERTPTSRTWGPYPDQNNPGREVRLVISRERGEDSDRFQWSIDVRRQGEGTWLSAVTGAYVPAAGADDIRKGNGELHFDAARVRRAGFAGADDDKNLQRIDAAYQTDGDPVRVYVDLEFAVESFLGRDEYALHYESDRFEDRSGYIRFDLRYDLVKSLGDPKPETLTIYSRWLPAGEGRAEVTVTGGELGSTVFLGGAECWDGEFKTVWGQEHTDFDIDENGVKGESVGSEDACAISSL